ncbi:MAG: hypothetical protein BA863_08945 [Desulfovibrio sp. S3730MH75]|nr:MAG: hypothetical protein BA863_08945 [Desulfovibrio sp. S3730MH75]
MSAPTVAEELRFWLPIIVFLSQLGVGWLIWSLRKAFVSRENCASCRKEMDEDADELEKRIIRNEEQLANQPTSKEVSELTVALGSLSGEIDVLAERINGVKDSQTSLKELVVRVDTFLREKG